MAKDRAQDAEQETAEMVVEPGHPGNPLSRKFQVEAKQIGLRKT